MKKLAIGLSIFMFSGLTVGLFMEQKAMTSLPEQTQTETFEEQVQLTEEQDPILPFTDQEVDYTINQDEFLVTFDQGENWMDVPIEPQSLFNGEYSGNYEELINNSYLLTKQKAMFMYAIHEGNGLSVRTISSTDQGQSWQDSVVTDSIPYIRYRKMELVNETFGYLIFTGDRTMSSEMPYVYLTYDGGVSWTSVGIPDTLRLVADGGFVDESTGFLSYGVINPDAPDFYVTNDAGNSWTEAEIQVPDEYKEIFVQAESPFILDDQLLLHINQGSNGDYAGGLIKGEFSSKDNGLTWEFNKDVEPDDIQ
ncbi:sialidase family protein [Alkalihalobacillus sp. FSL W8-0930]